MDEDPAEMPIVIAPAGKPAADGGEYRTELGARRELRPAGAIFAEESVVAWREDRS